MDHVDWRVYGLLEVKDDEAEGNEGEDEEGGR